METKENKEKVPRTPFMDRFQAFLDENRADVESHNAIILFSHDDASEILAIVQGKAKSIVSMLISLFKAKPNFGEYFAATILGYKYLMTNKDNPQS